MHRNRRSIQFRPQPRLLANVREVRRKPIADINRGPNHSRPSQLRRHRQSRLREKMRMFLRRFLHSRKSSRRPLQSQQLRRSTAQRARHINQISHMSTRTQPRPPPLHRTQHHNIEASRPQRTRRIPPGQRDPISIRRRQQPIQKPLHPGPPAPRLNQLPRQRHGQKRRHRLRAHRRNVAQPARQTLVPHRFRRVPLPAEMHAFQGEIRRNHQLFIRCRTYDGAVVANPQPQRSRRAAPPRPCANRRNQRLFRQSGFRSQSPSRINNPRIPNC